MQRLAPHTRALVTAFAVALCALAAAQPANAGLLVSSVGPCGSGTLERPFLRWLDPAAYVLAPGGSFESGTGGWKLAGAKLASGNETYYVHGKRDSRSLRLPAGSSATSPSICVGLEHPTLRLFARNTGSLLSTLRVNVLFEDAGGNVRSLPVGLVLGGSSWRPTLPVLVVANLLPLLPGQHTAVAFSFSVQGAGDWRIDDVYVDPYHK